MASKETKLVRELADILNETELAEIEMRQGDLKIRVSKSGSSVVQAVAAAPPAAIAPTASAPGPTSTSAPADAAPSTKGEAVESPMVGTAYIRPSPDADAFVAIGGAVKAGDTILLVEAMKTFNPIVAPRDGTITEVRVGDAQPVEYGEVLFVID